MKERIKVAFSGFAVAMMLVVIKPDYMKHGIGLDVALDLVVLTGAILFILSPDKEPES